MAASLYDPARYYKPYISDDSELESDSDSDGYISEESLLNTPGKHEPILSEVYEETDVKSSGPGASGTEFKTSESKNTSLFMINSRDRDTRSYPQPTFFTLRLPRTFKNIRQINLSQLNLLNSFFNFSKEKGNTWMYVYELGRTVKDSSGVDISNAVKIQIRNGTYSADDLVLELNNALNSTPLFADIGLGDFINAFQATGNFTLLFNTPGTVVFNSLTQTYDRNQTINNIVARYFQTVQNVGTISYSYDQCLVAYYYPIVKEMIIEEGTPSFSVVGQEIPEGFASWYDYLVFAFQGLNDPYVTPIVKDPGNQAIFDQYRFERTFNNFLVNKYTCTYNTKQGRLVITATSLNDSIVNDLTSQYNNILNSLVVQNGFSNINDFNSQYANVNNSNGALIELYNFIQNRFTSNFGVNFGTYTAEFYTDSNNEIAIYNTNNKYGWNLTLTPQVSQNAISSFVNPPQSSNWWSNIGINEPVATLNGIDFVSTLCVPEFVGGKELYFSGAGEQVFGYTDISFSIIPTNYARIAFYSKCRQNISIMTLPRYIDERGPGTEIVYELGSNTTPILYDTGPGTDFYINTDISGNPLFNFYTVAQNMFASADYMRSYDEWLQYVVPQTLAGIRVQQDDPNYNQRPPLNDIGLNSFRPYQFYQVNADQYLVEPNARFRITFYVETQGGNNFPVPIVVTWYKDRAGFMADVQQDLDGNLSFENPRHYFQRTVYGTNTNSAQMTVTVNNLQQTYFMVHVQDRTTVPASIPLRIFCLLTDPYGEYTSATQLDRLDMPYAGLPPIADQFTPDSSIYKDPLRSVYASTIFQLGYDISGVSNNLLDYIIQGNNILYDPTNVESFENSVSTGLRYQFNLNSAISPQPLPTISSTKWSLYFGSNSSNLIRDLYSLGSNIYLSSLQVPKPLEGDPINHATIVNWFKSGNPNIVENYIYPSLGLSYFDINPSTIFMPAINTPTSLNTDMYTNPALPDNEGISGFSFFLPPNQVVQLDDITLKFVYTQPSETNLEVPFTRSNSPLTLATGFNQAFYRNESTETYLPSTTLQSTINNSFNEWDDWYLFNRRNIKIAIFSTDDISGANINDLSLSTAICSMTLKKVTQVNNYQNKLGTLRTREPEWGTYYTYEFDHAKPGLSSNVLWDVTTPLYAGGDASNYWRSTIVPFDYAPTYTAGNTVYENYFLTHPRIFNYSYLPRSIGIAPTVDNAITNPDLQGNYTDDIPNSYTAVPFYFDASTQDWKVGSFYGLSFTSKPAMPPLSNVASAPYYGPPGIYAWKNDGSDNLVLHNGLGTSFTAFYFNAKINYDVLDVGYDPATDLAAFGGFTGISNEYQDTMLFFYKNGEIGEDYGDISTTYASNITSIDTRWVWGQESNVRYYAYDDQGGYNFLSYVYDVPVRTSVEEYAIHVRAYDPIPSFNTGVRFIGKNYTDFGKPQLGEIAQEISSLWGYTYISDEQASIWMSNWVNSNDFSEYNSTISTNNYYRDLNFFSHEYADSLKKFDTLFDTTAIFGKTLTYNGLSLTFTGYEDCLTQYIGLYSSIRNVILVYTDVLSTATGELNQYVVERYSNILPPAVLNRNRITDPLPFQFLFKSKLTSPYDKMYDEWGLGYNLGFEKRDTTPPRTTIVSDTFIRIVQDYIYLRLNPEFNVNTMGVSAKEDLSISKDPVSEDQKYFSKIILNNFGSFCRTAVQLPKIFNPVLGKYDTISCQLVDRNGAQISSLDCEYDFVLEITEITNGPVENATLQGPTSDLAIYKEERKSVKLTQEPSRSGAKPRITTNPSKYVLNLPTQTNVISSASGV